MSKVFILADIPLIGNEMRFSLLAKAKTGFHDTHVWGVKRAQQIDNSASIA